MRSAWLRVAAACVVLLVAIACTGCSGSFADALAGLKPKPAPLPAPGRAVPLMSSDRHIERGERHEPYSTDPPTSGPHYELPAESGFYTVAPPDEELVHSLQHGYVIIWYRTKDLEPEERKRLTADIWEAMETAGDSIYTGTPKLIAVPRPKMKSAIALTTWGRLDELDRFDRQEILRFIKQFRDEAPEYTEP